MLSETMPSTRRRGRELAVIGAGLPSRNVADSGTARTNESRAAESAAMVGATTPAAESTHVRMLVTAAAVMLSVRARWSAAPAAFTESCALFGEMNVVNCAEAVTGAHTKRASKAKRRYDTSPTVR